MPLDLQLLDITRFFGRQHLGKEAADADLLANRLRRSLVVARHHHHGQATRLHGGDGFAGAFLNSIGHANEGGGTAVDRQPHDRLALALQMGGRFLQAV